MSILFPKNYTFFECLGIVTQQNVAEQQPPLDSYPLLTPLSPSIYYFPEGRSGRFLRQSLLQDSANP